MLFITRQYFMGALQLSVLHKLPTS